MQIIIHRGTEEIGGTCIELSTQNTTILLDLGAPLSKESKDLDLSNKKVDAIFISHPHQDHFGLIDIIDSNIPVYIGKLGKNLIDATRMLLSKELYPNNFKFFRKNEVFNIGEFSVTPYLVDHSSVDAYGFLIEADNKRIFYSGDFRAHGNKSFLFKEIVTNPPKDIDLLFMEGTMIDRTNDEFPTEKSVMKKIYETIINQNNISFLISSSQNIDRIVSAYHACENANKTLVIDFYTAWVLEKVKSVTRSVPTMDWDNVRVYADKTQDDVLKNNPDFFGDFRKRVYKYRVQKKELHDNPSRYLYLGKMSKFKIINLYKWEKPVNVIYSQWLGYLKFTNDEYYGAEQISAYQHDTQINFVYAHTSGHATIEDLQTFAKALNPKKLIPIHTEYKDQYCKYFENVLMIEDATNLSL